MVAPARERGLKSRSKFNRSHGYKVAPARERGLKFFPQVAVIWLPPRRSRKGAWIEIPDARLQRPEYLGRSRKGAWIEMIGSTSAVSR